VSRVTARSVCCSYQFRLNGALAHKTRKNPSHRT
jgi:hypothetical protein